MALKRVEVLRDGASAQYGSDAIAGVINFVMEDDPHLKRLQVQYGSTYEGDGDQVSVTGSAGMRLGTGGFARLATEFDLGAQSQFERLINADFTLPVDIGAYSSLNVAVGAQHHKEVFRIEAGDTESSAPGGFEDQGFSVGSNGFQGFSADVAGRFSRDSYAGYIDLDVDVTSRWLVESLTLPPTNPVAVLKGGKPLEPEESVNWSLGAAFSLGAMDITLDWFHIEVDGRIALTRQALSDQDRADLIGANIVGAETVTAVTFFVNDIDSRTTGIDLVVDTGVDRAGGRLNITLAGNLTDTEITDPGVTLTAATSRELEDALPDMRATLTADFARGAWSGLIRVNYYDSVSRTAGTPARTLEKASVRALSQRGGEPRLRRQRGKVQEVSRRRGRRRPVVRGRRGTAPA